MALDDDYPLALPADRPIVLLPIRIETRYLYGAQHTLGVRIYPDTLHVDSHRRELTDTEQALRDRYIAAAAAGAAEAAWQELARTVGAARAAYLAQATLAPAQSVPCARLLPERFAVLAYPKGGGPMFWKVTAPVTGDDADLAGRRLPLDVGDDASWMFDFQAAQARGMAIELTTADGPIDALARLVVIGVCATGAGERGLADLLAAHRFTDGIGIVPTGAPTNNSDAASAWYSSRDASPSVTFDREIAPATLPVDCAATRLAAALGIAPDALAHADGARIDRAPLTAAERACKTALWPATLGYFLTNLVDGTVGEAGVDLLAIARAHLIDRVDNRGLPILRIGRQPYGVVPAIQLASAAGAWSEGPRQRLRDLLATASTLWLRCTGEVPRARPPSDPDAEHAKDYADPHQRVVSMLAMTPVSSGASARSVLGGAYCGYLASFLPWQLDADWWTRHHEKVAAAFDGIAVAGVAVTQEQVMANRVARTVPSETSSILHAPAVPDDPSALFALDPLAWDQLLATTELVPGAATPLAFLLLRHAALAAQTWAAYRVLVAAGTITDPTWVAEPELVWNKLGQLGSSVTLAQPLLRMKQPLAYGGATNDVKTWLANAANGTDLGPVPAVVAAELRELRDAWRMLGTVGAGDLEALLRESLDLSSHRLDAWITGVASARLSEVGTANGVHVGAYGWVEDLAAPSAPPQPVPVAIGSTTVDAVESTRAGGFVHAPTVAHAVTAAILRSGYLAQRDAADDHAPFSIDLSSARARDALGLLDGVRDGVALGAQLGYRLERRLAEQDLARYIAHLRTAAIKLADPDVAPPSELAAGVPVDGLVAWAAWASGAAAFYKQVGITTDDQPAVEAVFAELDAAIDAVTDLVTAESVHQLAAGRVESAGAIADLATRADAVPPAIDVVRSSHAGRLTRATGDARAPRAPVEVQHRVLALVLGEPPAGWARGPRAQAEPALEALAASWLGAASDFTIGVRYLDAAGVELATSTLALADLGLCALDVVVEAGDVGSPLARRLTGAADRARPGAATIELVTAAAAAGQRGFAELAVAAKRIRALLAGARAATPKDLVVDSDGDVATTDIAALASRLAAVDHDALIALAARLRAAGDADRAGVLLEAAGYGLPAAIPDRATADAAVAQTAAAELERRAAALATAGDPATADGQLARLRTILGSDALVVPPVRWTSRPVLVDALAHGGIAVDALAVRGWLAGAGRTRDGVARLERVIAACEITGGAAPSPIVAQTPASTSWVGLAPPDDDAARVSAVAIVTGSGDGVAAGIVIDTWSEQMPAVDVTTGLALHVEHPASRAPNAILVAVPAADAQWRASAVAAIVGESLDLAKVRAIDPDALVATAHVLPAIYLACNERGDTVTTDITLDRPAADRHPPALQNTSELSITSWVRVEPRCRDGSLAEGLEARVHDPLWMLARQWQFGEFDGEDAASPIRVDVACTTATLAAGPIEVLAEAVPRTSAIAAGAVDNRRLAIESGRALFAALDAANAGSERARFLAKFALADEPRLPAASRDVLAVASQRVPDGEAVAAALADRTKLLDDLGIPDADRDAVGKALDAFAAWRAALFAEPVTSAWQPDRYESSASIVAAGSDVEVRASRYPGTGLDWYTWDLAAGSQGTALAQWARPTMASFSGMPMPRHWELEDGSTNLHVLDATAGDISRLLLVDFAVVYSGDWSVAPLVLPAASAIRIDAVVVRDTFGQYIRIRHPSELDQGATWRLFELSPLAAASRGWTMTTCGLPDPLEGTAEEIALVRDELANVGWGIETLLEDPLGESIVVPNAAAAPSGSGYHVAASAPAGRYPYRRILRDDVAWLARTTLAGSADAAPAGELLQAPSIPEVELVGGALRVARVYRFARSAAGAHLWIAHVRSPAPPPARVGLAFDVLDASR